MGVKQRQLLVAVHGIAGIVGHGGRGAFVAWEERRFDNVFSIR